MKRYAFGSLTEIDRAKAEETRTVEFIISSSARDRYQTVLNMRGWQLDNFNRNPIVGYQHNVYGDNMCAPANPDDVLGPGRAWVDGDVLRGSVTFEERDINPLAEKIFRKVMNGTLRATSVGFMEVGKGKYGEGEERSGGKDETYYFEGQELLEFSIVNIPANPEAVGRSIGNHTEAALGYLMRFMPEHVSIRDIKKMTVQEVLDHVRGTVTDQKVNEVEQLKRKMRIVNMDQQLKLN